MNKQGKRYTDESGIIKVRGGIEWLKTLDDLGNESQGFTVNPVAGCLHDCRWIMPDGQIAECYAKTTAEGVAQAAYPQGFEQLYWRPDTLERPERVKTPSKIFWDSMSDLFGYWVPVDYINQVLEMARRAPQHQFLSLTKNAVRLNVFDGFLPPNVWPGVSTPPDYMWGKSLTGKQKLAYLEVAFKALAKFPDHVSWMSFEPLSWDVSKIVADYPGVLKWAVIGAATNGKDRYQPDPGHVQNLLDVLDGQGVPVFFKGNLEWTPWRENFPNELGGIE